MQSIKLLPIRPAGAEDLSPCPPSASHHDDLTEGVCIGHPKPNNLWWRSPERNVRDLPSWDVRVEIADAPLAAILCELRGRNEGGAINVSQCQNI